MFVQLLFYLLDIYDYGRNLFFIDLLCFWINNISQCVDIFLCIYSYVNSCYGLKCIRAMEAELRAAPPVSLEMSGMPMVGHSYCQHTHIDKLHILCYWSKHRARSCDASCTIAYTEVSFLDYSNCRKQCIVDFYLII